jgi:hypothetical protein
MALFLNAVRYASLALRWASVAAIVAVKKNREAGNPGQMGGIFDYQARLAVVDLRST